MDECVLWYGTRYWAAHARELNTGELAKKLKYRFETGWNWATCQLWLSDLHWCAQGPVLQNRQPWSTDEKPFNDRGEWWYRRL